MWRKTNGKKKQRLSTKEGTNSAKFSANFTYYINTFSSVTTPPVYSLHWAKNGKLVKEIKNNTDLKEKEKFIKKYGGDYEYYCQQFHPWKFIIISILSPAKWTIRDDLWERVVWCQKVIRVLLSDLSEGLFCLKFDSQDVYAPPFSSS